MSLSPLVRRYDHVLLDLDGCVWVGDEPTPRATDAVATIREAGKGIAFVTNDTLLNVEEYVRKLWRLGFRASPEEVVTAGAGLQFRLAERGGGSAFVIGRQAVFRHVEMAGQRIVNGTDLAARADVVVVARDDDFDYAALRTAVQAVSRGAALFGASRDPSFPMPDGPWPGSGALLAAVEYATGAVATTVGKPEPDLFLTALDRLGPGRALVVGDRLDSDLAGARSAQLDAAIVLTGATDRAGADAAADPSPVAVAETLAGLVFAGDGG